MKLDRGITRHACARDKAIGFVVVVIIIHKNRQISIDRDQIAQFVVFIVLSKHLEAKSCDFFTIFGILTALATLRTLVPFMVYMTSMILLAFSVTLNSHALSL